MKIFLIGYRVYGYISLFIATKFSLVATICIFPWLVDYENPTFFGKIRKK